MIESLAKVRFCKQKTGYRSQDSELLRSITRLLSSRCIYSEFCLLNPEFRQDVSFAIDSIINLSPGGHHVS
jgi:hypothetical protein